jgi:predicted metal-dependent phosphoesterase TrpH
MKTTFKVDLHSHTRFSIDATTRVEQSIIAARDAGLDRIAITDHNTIEGALIARAIDPGFVIVGEEIDCACGTDVIGLFLREHVPAGLSLEETAERIRAQGGVVYAPHPFAYLTRPVWRAERLFACADLIEAFNARAFYGPWNRRALQVAEERGVPIGAGSDAHMPWEIGRAYTELPAFANAAEFRAGLSQARATGLRVSSPFVHGVSIALHGARLLTGRSKTPVPPSIRSREPVAE